MLHTLKLNLQSPSSHMNERPFACTACDGKFKTKAALANHNQFRHATDARVHMCTASVHCRKRFVTAADRRRHEREVKH